MFRHLSQSELKRAIDQLESKERRYVDVEDHIIGRPTIQTSDFYIFKKDEENRLSKEASGTIYRAYKLARDGTPVLDEHKPQRPKLFSVKVVQATHSYMHEDDAKSAIAYKDEILVFAEYIPGTDLATDYLQSNPILQHSTLDQSFTEAAKLIKFIQAKGAIAHLDAKESSEVPEIKGNSKIDIYSLVPVFACIFGASDPCNNKCLGKLYPYQYTDMFTQPNLPMDFSSITSCVPWFFDRMQSSDPTHRPDINEVLTFFISLKQLHDFCIARSSHNLKNTVIAKLVLLASGLWNHSIETSVGERGESKSEEKAAPRTFKDVDFENEPRVCEKIAYHITVTSKQALDILSSFAARPTVSAISESKEEKRPEAPSTSTPPPATIVATALPSQNKSVLFKKPDTPLSITGNVILLLTIKAATLPEKEQQLVLVIAGIASLIAKHTSTEIAEKIIRITHVLIIDSQKNNENILDGLIKNCSRGKWKNGSIYKLIEAAVKLDEKKPKTTAVSDSKAVANISAKEANHLENLIEIVNRIKESKKIRASNQVSVRF